jgi:hypothetical protein
VNARLRTGTLLAALACCALTLSACRSTWTRTPEGGANLTRGDYTARIPGGWMRHSGRGSLDDTITLDGTDIHSITFALQSLDQAFPILEREATPDLLPSELAELTVAELKAGGFDNLEVVSEGPAIVAGQESFRLHLRHRQPTGLRVDHLIYGFATDSGAYRLVFSAPTLYFFERDRPVFEELVRGVHRKAEAPPSP